MNHVKTKCVLAVFTIGESSSVVKNFHGVQVKPHVSSWIRFLEDVATYLRHINNQNVHLDPNPCGRPRDQRSEFFLGPQQ
jgi:hypothetical protein